jgi:glutamine amidotransferase
MTTKIEIIDLGINNIGSLVNAVNRLESVQVKVISSAGESSNPNLVILPGNGSFGQGAHALRSRGFEEYLLSRHKDQGHILGICLGMHLLCEGSEESEGEQGLGIFSGKVMLLSNDSPVPHSGWEDVYWSPSSPIQYSPTNTPSFYFMHSYALPRTNSENQIAETPRGESSFSSAANSGNTLGVQFHPEKSSKSGARFLERVRKWSNG